MKKLLAAIAVMFSMTHTASAEMSPKEAATLLSQSIVEYGPKLYEAYCTAFAIGDRLFMTAGHCATKAESWVSKDWKNVKVSALTVGVDGKNTNGLSKDWTIIYTTGNIDGVVPLTLGCNEELYIGMPIAYMGFPYPMKNFFSTGYISSLDSTRSPHNQSDVKTNLLAAGPGASGSPVISLDTGHVIGILTEGYSAKVGVVSVGLEGISEEMCEHSAIDGIQSSSDGIPYSHLNGADRPDVVERTD